MTFKEELAQLINKHSKENKSNTPDFILAQYLNNCLMCFEIAVDQREVWHGRPSPKDVKLEDVLSMKEIRRAASYCGNMGHIIPTLNKDTVDNNRLEEK